MSETLLEWFTFVGPIVMFGFTVLIVRSCRWLIPFEEQYAEGVKKGVGFIALLAIVVYPITHLLVLLVWIGAIEVFGGGA